MPQLRLIRVKNMWALAILNITRTGQAHLPFRMEPCMLMSFDFTLRNVIHNNCASVYEISF